MNIELKGKGGVYYIRNKINNKLYIGSTRNFNRRWRSHLCNLRHERASIALQGDYNLYGEDAFEFGALKICQPSELLLYEQKLVAEYAPEYNIESKIYSHEITPTTIERIRESKLGVKRDFTSEWKNNIKNSASKRKHTKAELDKVSQVYRGFKSPDGAEYRNILNLAEFCRQYGLLQGSMWAVDRGITKAHRGWTKITDKEYEEIIAKENELDGKGD